MSNANLDAGFESGVILGAAIGVLAALGAAVEWSPIEIRAADYAVH